jgi:hypothetical protein
MLMKKKSNNADCKEKTFQINKNTIQFSSNQNENHPKASTCWYQPVVGD